MGVGLRPGAKAAGRATDPLPATRLPSTLHESGRYPSTRDRSLMSQNTSDRCDETTQSASCVTFGGGTSTAPRACGGSSGSRGWAWKHRRGVSRAIR